MSTTLLLLANLSVVGILSIYFFVWSYNLGKKAKTEEDIYMHGLLDGLKLELKVLRRHVHSMQKDVHYLWRHRSKVISDSLELE